MMRQSSPRGDLCMCMVADVHMVRIPCSHVQTITLYVPAVAALPGSSSELSSGIGAHRHPRRSRRHLVYISIISVQESPCCR